ncbi:MAG: peptidase [Clostridia bacterium]|nr:peptidase [Clostridia bacterium]
MNIQTGISIIMDRWLQVRREELIHLITDETHLREAEAIYEWARSHDAVLKTTVLPSKLIQNGEVVEKMADILSVANIIIGATDYSFITTRAVGEAVAKGARFLSLPLSCTDGTSLLENDFIDMDMARAKHMATRLLRRINRSDTLRVTTRKGTDLTFTKRGRVGGYFNGSAPRRGCVSSASFEVYVPVEEHSAEGELTLDGSAGYIGLIKTPVRIAFSKGRIVGAEGGDDANRLMDYIKSFRCQQMYNAGEFGIGLNTLARCRGVSYIEDESTYGTFHIGMGRNLSLGGCQDAAGHFDIVTHAPTIYAQGAMIVMDGEIL